MTNKLEEEHSTTPVPDPTSLTTAALVREIASLKEIIFTRLEGMDKAIILFNENLTKTPTEIDKQIGHLKALHSEKFASIQTQFTERDTRTEQTSRDSKVAVDAALQAAKEAVGEQNKSSSLAIAKSEAATGKQIDQMGLLVASTNAGLNDKIDDLKDRLTKIESTDKGERGVRDDNKAMIAIIISALVGLVVVLELVFRIAK